VFPITTCFNPICFPQSPLLFTYIGAPNGEALHLSIESSILGGLHSLWWANQIGSLQKENKIKLVKHPQLINMKQNKYPWCYKRGSHMPTERVLVTIRGENK
jgi:hypothetical protein